MSRWWRAYDEAVDDPKLILLNDRQHRAWFNLCCVTSQNGGVLPPVKMIAVKLRVTPDKAKDMVAQLVALGLIDNSGNGIFAPHNWGGRQFQSDVSTERVKRFRNAHRNVSETVSETAPETEADTEPEQRKKEPRACALVGDWPSDAFDKFWAEYPTKIAKKAAIRAFATAKRSSVTFERLMSGLARYKTEKPPQVEWCHPATWLNGGRWEDQPAASATNGQRTYARNAGESAVLAGLARAFGDRDGGSSGPADAEIPRGRFEFDAEPTRRS